jgi:hypothetical protein
VPIASQTRIKKKKKHRLSYDTPSTGAVRYIVKKMQEISLSNSSFQNMLLMDSKYLDAGVSSNAIFSYHAIFRSFITANTPTEVDTMTIQGSPTHNSTPVEHCSMHGIAPSLQSFNAVLSIEA